MGVQEDADVIIATTLSQEVAPAAPQPAPAKMVPMETSAPVPGVTKDTPTAKPGDMFHPSHHHPLKLEDLAPKILGITMTFLNSITCDACGTESSSDIPVWHCRFGCNFDVCQRCWKNVHGEQTHTYNFKLTSDMFEKFMDRVLTRVDEWEEEQDPRSHMSLDSWKRRVLVFHSKSQSLTWCSFPEARTKYDGVVIGRLTGFELVGTRSKKGEFEYVLWSTDLDVMTIMNPPEDKSWF